MLKRLSIWLLMIMCAKVFGQTLPSNIGFEDGSFNNWNFAAGRITTNGTQSFINMSASSPVYGRHTLLSKQVNGLDVDPYGKFPVICPNGGNYTLRLGNDLGGGEIESVNYTFRVPDEWDLAYSITFNYAVVLENPDHQEFEQPRFVARVYDVATGQYVACQTLDFVSGSALPGFTRLPASGGKQDIFYKSWSTATIDLHDYLGRIIRLEFVTNDCAHQKHFGYAYVDIDQTKLAAPISGNIYCPGQLPIILKGPEGFERYRWFNGDNTQFISEGQNLVLNETPPNLTRFALEVTPYPGLGCPSIFKTEIVQIEDNFKLVTHDVTACPETGADLTAYAVTQGSTAGLVYNYFTDASLRTHVTDSTHIALSGTYYIMGISASGCKDAVPVKVNLVNYNINVSDPVPVRYPATVDISKSFIPDPELTYSYFSDQSTTIPLTNYTAINKSGDYFIKIKNPLGCEILRKVTVRVLPPLPFVADAPNVFTPNNDGINDKFGMHLDGFIRFNSIDVFNRNGQLLFHTKSVTDLWDGNYNGRPLPTGTYYWIFNGLDTYYNTAVKKNGYVSIIR